MATSITWRLTVEEIISVPPPTGSSGCKPAGFVEALIADTKGGYRSRKNSFPSKDEFPDPECDVALEGNGPVQILDPEDRISKYWQEDPEKRHLHLIVQLPHDGKRKREDPVDISMELYDKWNVSLPITPNLTDLEAPLGPEEKMRPFVSDRNKTDEQLLGSNCIRVNLLDIRALSEA
ncbi:uncharacterized protein EI90DRAFT_3130686 [Cantharellus anzutake]|uniref:uncharacterized protein n=1 Tax=Cantharellus anzutake TaxID=1750568 RepID=UPI001903892F|nr:uncharacterized protein EI90DRAFT_3130686 [Cantharellus anzutake]KAF8322906.1 hypothetical protein EI90DRAFT_3130686 [Cantharellus anzutake]